MCLRAAIHDVDDPVHDAPGHNDHECPDRVDSGCPPDGLIVTQPELLVLGLTSSDAEVTVNGQPAVVSGPAGVSSFGVTMTLSERANSVNVYAEEPGGAPTEITVEVRYLPDAIEMLAFINQVSSSTEVIADLAEFLTGQERSTPRSRTVSPLERKECPTTTT